MNNKNMNQNADKNADKENSKKVGFDLVELEKEVLEFWRKNDILKKYLAKNKNAKKKWSFLDGPITANNPMGVHHAWGRTYKDLFCRFKTMQGYQQRYQNGFDGQGLWVEVEVEKELGFKTKKDIEDFGIDKFVNKCKERVAKYSAIQTEQSKRLGYFMDWDNSYFTTSPENNYAIWHFLKVCHERSYIYKGRDAVPWCPRCGTAISQHEISTEEYKNITHKTCYVKAKIKKQKSKIGDASLLVWTTTPWTLLANVAIAVNPKLKYAVVEENGEKLIILEKLAKKILPNAKIIKTFSGQELIGLEYKGILDDLPEHRVIDGRDLVNEKEGTGLVHVAPGAGAEDFALGKKEKLPVIVPIDDEGKILAGFGDFSGKFAGDLAEDIFAALKKKDVLFRVEEYTHRYPVCWRCKTELLFRVVDEWYISMDKLRQPMMEIAKKIKWLPEFGLKQELDWLKNMSDWLISKKRYWGLALPIWECGKCNNFEVIGSREELQEKAVEGWEKFDPPAGGQTPHRPWIDEVKIKCSKCGEKISRVKDVGNPWLDAGIVPFSTMPADWFPAEFITESFPGQFRNWFYSLIAMATVLKNEPPFLTVLGHASVRDEKGEEMHKSKGNAIWFDEAADKVGVETMRWLYLTANPFENLRFGWHTLDDIRRQYILILMNVFSFYQQKFSDGKLVQRPVHRSLGVGGSFSEGGNILDCWIIARLNEVIEIITNSLEKYEPMTASRALEAFIIEDLSKWYLRRSRKREDQDFSRIFCEVLLSISKLLAPFSPFISESIYQELKTIDEPESVHLTDWPVGEENKKDNDVVIKMNQAREICELGHAKRDETKIPVRQPLAKITVFGGGKLEKEYEDIIAGELNVKGIQWGTKGDKGEVKGDKGKQRGTKGNGKELWVELDTEITAELKLEGEKRELIRWIQDYRKKNSCNYNDVIEIEIKDKADVLRKFKTEIEKATKTKIREK